MKLKLMISERRPNILTAWSDVFSGVKDVVLLNVGAKDLMARPDIDAELMLGMFAHERYGGRDRHGESQILSTHAEPGAPPWVVTVAPLPLDAPESLTHEENVYRIFTTAFRRIGQFNQSDKEPIIQTLGFDLEFLFMPWGDNARKEAEAAHRAYIEYFSDT